MTRRNWTVRSQSRFLALALSALAMVCGPRSSSAEIDVRLDSDSFNPSLGDRVAISWTLASEAATWLRVYDPDGGLVRTLLDGELRPAGRQTIHWDGRDLEGRVVPDEAYYVTFETSDGVVYDPTAFSGGVVGDVTDARVDFRTGTLSYRLPAASRVLVRLGIRSGPLLRTLVDWKPRVAGSITEHWDGLDENGLVELRNAPGFSILVTYVSLPVTSVIAYGNTGETYRAYKLGRAAGRPQKAAREPDPARFERLRPEGLVPPAWARAPRVRLEFPTLDKAGLDNGLDNASADGTDMATPAPTVPGGDVAVHVDVDPQDRERLLADQFEIILFVDNVFFAEAERGYLPFNWRWELDSLSPGEHVLTVNVSSFKGQVGVASRKIRIEAGNR